MTKDSKQRVTLFLNPRLLKVAKAQAVIEEVSLTVLVERALVRCLPEKLQILRPTLKKKGGE